MADKPTTTPSGIVYLYGERFVAEGGLTGARVELPCRGFKVKRNDVAEMAFASAFIDLAHGGYLKLSLGQRRGTLGIRQHPTVEAQALTPTVAVPASLEARILKLAPNNVVEFVREIVPESADPWGEVIEAIRQGLLAQGYFAEGKRGGLAKFLMGKKLVPNCPLIALLEDLVAPVSAMLDSFKAANAELYAQLTKDISAALKSRVEREDSLD